MQADNPAGLPCPNKELGPDHSWIRRADGTAVCTHCGVNLDVKQTADAFPTEVGQVNRKAGGKASAAKAG